jgi:hypothetical protein
MRRTGYITTTLRQSCPACAFHARCLSPPTRRGQIGQTRQSVAPTRDLDILDVNAIMPPPNDAPTFSTGTHLIESDLDGFLVSPPLGDLLSEAREQYVWSAQTALESQGNIARLERETALRLADLHGDNAQWIIQEVSRWGGNNERAVRTIASASPEQKQTFANLISQLVTSDSTEYALRALTRQPGIGLVMASKIYRFCCPQSGAAVDRHTSYFFNSLSVRCEVGKPKVCTRFTREWADGRHRASRLAVYTDAKCDANLKEYCSVYLPVLGRIADALNSQRGGFICAINRTKRLWRPADVEMAAYFWWAKRAKDSR